MTRFISPVAAVSRSRRIAACWLAATSIVVGMSCANSRDDSPRPALTLPESPNDSTLTAVMMSQGPVARSSMEGPSSPSALDPGAPGGKTAEVPAALTIFGFDRPNIVRRSNIVLGAPNLLERQFMPIGNGTLGVPVWAAGGFTAQLNRSDTFPDRKSAGQVTVPGLATLTSAADFSGRLDVYSGTLFESGGGMTLVAYVRADAQQLIVDVTGADPNSLQTANVALWTGRTPQAGASGSIATLSETWSDSAGPDGSPGTFGVLAALTAAGRDVVASVVDDVTVRVTFQPNEDGSFRIVVGCPNWTGGDALAAATALLGADATTSTETLRAGHLVWWQDYWGRVDLIKMSSADGSAEYLENIRTLYLYLAAAGRGGPLPASQAGIADLFAFGQDHHDWFPAGYWVWNLRAMLAANETSGIFELNAPIFLLYRSNLANLQAWTRAHMGGRDGICLPETMRFNGNGYYNGGLGGASCEQSVTPTYNSLNVSSGAEVGLWVYEHYRMTGDEGFLADHYPLLREAARFLLAYATEGADGLLHTVANAHELQWNVQDPVTDILAMRALFPAVIAAAELLGVDAELVTELHSATAKIPPLPRTDTATHSQLLGASADAAGQNAIAVSYQPTAPLNNQENLDLEAVWPYALIGDASADTELARRTYTYRRFTNTPDWSLDPVHAARLGLASEVARDLVAITQKYQAYPSGMASWQSPPSSNSREPYLEQAATATLAINEALVQSNDDLLKIAPAWPAAWNGAGAVHIRGGTRVTVVIENASVVAAVLEAGSTRSQRVRNPWVGSGATVLDGATGELLVANDTATEMSVQLTKGHWYVIRRGDTAMMSVQRMITGTPAVSAKRLGSQSIGL